MVDLCPHHNLPSFQYLNEIIHVHLFLEGIRFGTCNNIIITKYRELDYLKGFYNKLGKFKNG